MAASPCSPAASELGSTPMARLPADGDGRQTSDAAEELQRRTRPRDRAQVQAPVAIRLHQLLADEAGLRAGASTGSSATKKGRIGLEQRTIGSVASTRVALVEMSGNGSPFFCLDVRQ